MKKWLLNVVFLCLATSIQAAPKGFVEAPYVIATMSHDGEGTTQDLAAAKKWYEAAANQSENPEVATLAREGLEELK